MRFLLLFLMIPATIAGSENNLVAVVAEKTVVKAGRQNTIHLTVSVKPGFHIQADKLSNDAFIPTTLVVKSYTGITTETPVFPKAKKFRLEGMDDELDVFDGTFRIMIAVQADKQAQKGKHSLEAELRYQACDEKICFFPKTIPFTIPLGIK